MIRLGFAVGACMQTARLPHLILELKDLLPQLELRFSISPHAEAFVTPTVLQGISGQPVYSAGAKFDPITGEPFHLLFSRLDALIMYPATARIVSSAALGIISCPVTRCFAFMPKERVILTPYLHPAMSPEIYRGHLETLSGCGCQLVAPDDGLVWRDRSSWQGTVSAALEHLRRLSDGPSAEQFAARPHGVSQETPVVDFLRQGR